MRKPETGTLADVKKISAVEYRMQCRVSSLNIETQTARAGYWYRSWEGKRR